MPGVLRARDFPSPPLAIDPGRPEGGGPERGLPGGSLGCLLGVLGQAPRKAGGTKVHLPPEGQGGEKGQWRGCGEGGRGKRRRPREQRKKAKTTGLAAGAGRGAGKRLSPGPPLPPVRGQGSGHWFFLLPRGSCWDPASGQTPSRGSEDQGPGAALRGPASSCKETAPKAGTDAHPACGGVAGFTMPASAKQGQTDKPAGLQS